MVILRETLFIGPVQFNLLHCCGEHRQTDQFDIGYSSVSLTKTNLTVVRLFSIGLLQTRHCSTHNEIARMVCLHMCSWWQLRAWEPWESGSVEVGHGQDLTLTTPPGPGHTFTSLYTCTVLYYIVFHMMDMHFRVSWWDCLRQ